MFTVMLVFNLVSKIQLGWIISRCTQFYVQQTITCRSSYFLMYAIYLQKIRISVFVPQKVVSKIWHHQYDVQNSSASVTDHIRLCADSKLQVTGTLNEQNWLQSMYLLTPRLASGPGDRVSLSVGTPLGNMEGAPLLGTLERKTIRDILREM
jgi:hypothetical protein